MDRIQQIANGHKSKMVLRKLPVEIKQQLEGKTAIKAIIDDFWVH